VTTVMRRPISCVTSMAVSCHAPAVSMANGQKMWVLAKLAYHYHLLLPLIEIRQTFESSFDDATEAFVPDDLVEAITNGRKSDVDVDVRSHFTRHLSA